MTKKLNLLDILGERLSKLPDSARMAIVLDPKRVLEIPTSFLDNSNREWSVFLYDRNDLFLRASLPALRKNDMRILIVCLGVRSLNSTENIVDLSYIPDLLDEATEIIDCSPSGLLSNLIKDPLPPDLFEMPLLSLWAEDVNGLVHNFLRYAKMAGKGAIIDRFDAMAMTLVTSNSSINLEDLINLPLQPLQRLAFYLRTVSENTLDARELSIFQNIIVGADANKHLLAWCRLEKSELLRFVYLGLLVIGYAIPKGLEMLQQLGLLEFDLKQLGDSPEKVFNLMRRDLEFQRKIATEIEKSEALLSEIDKLAHLFKFGSFQDVLNAFAEEPYPAIVCYLGRLIISHVTSSKEGSLALASWQPRFKSSYPKTSFTAKAQKFSELLEHLSWLESTMAKAPTPPGDLLSLVNTYRMANIHLLELTMSETQDIARLLKDEQITEKLRPYFDQLREKIDHIVMAYDGALAKAICSDFKTYTNFQRLNIQTLRNLIQAGSPRKERVWIIILDGLRLDSWERFIWPKLREIFDLDGEEHLYLATLPSYTDVSRVSFLAGKLPPFWKDYYNQPTNDHNILLSRYLSLGKDESKKKLKIVARVEEKVEQGELDFGDAQYRVMIFNISDDWIHHEQGSLVRVNEAIISKFEKMVLSELPDKIEAGDIVLITSDHGFIELRKKFAHKIDESQLGPDLDMESVSYRYVQNGKDDRRIRITYDNKNSWIMAQGYEWFERPKQSGKVARYSHGGISMAEMVVPAVRLRKRTEKTVELLLTIETPAECCSGDTVKLPVCLANQGTVDTDVSLTCKVAGRLLAEESLILPAGVSHKWVVSVKAEQKANQVAISAKYTLPNKEKKIEKRQLIIPIKESGVKVEIDTSALDVFDNV